MSRDGDMLQKERQHEKQVINERREGRGVERKHRMGRCGQRVVLWKNIRKQWDLLEVGEVFEGSAADICLVSAARRGKEESMSCLTFYQITYEL